MKMWRTKECKACQFISSPHRLYCSAGLGNYSSWFSMTKTKRALADIQEKCTPLCVLNKSSSSITARFTISFLIYTRHPSVCYYNSSDPTSLHERKTCVSDDTNVLYWRKYGAFDSTAECTLTHPLKHTEWLQFNVSLKCSLYRNSVAWRHHTLSRISLIFLRMWIYLQKTRVFNTRSSRIYSSNSSMKLTHPFPVSVWTVIINLASSIFYHKTEHLWSSYNSASFLYWKAEELL
jgi:hypothetical protein